MGLMKNFSRTIFISLLLQFCVMFNVSNAESWKEGISYKAGDVVSYDNENYRCLVNHTAWAGTNWNPEDTPSLWVPCDGKKEETGDEESGKEEAENKKDQKEEYENNEEESEDIANWEEGENYNVGDIVLYDGVKYRCLVNHTAWVGTNWNPQDSPTLWVPCDGENNVEANNNESNQDQNQNLQQEDESNISDVPIVKSKGEWGEKVYAPYVDVMLWPTPSINSFMEATGNKYYTLAFILSNGGKPAWGGITPYNQGFYKDEISKLRQNGGDVIISFGGANGIELALEITDVEKLRDCYQAVIDEYQLTWVDFDIEGFAVSDKESIQRRNLAIAMLQKDNPNLTIAYCLPVMPEGLTTEGLYVLKDAKEKGVNIDVVNIMTMDYGSSYQGDMGQYAIEAGENAKKQIRNLGLGAKLGNTPMIGQNDVSVEKFTVDDAKKLLAWAKENDNMRLLSMWSVTRDKSKGTGLYNCTMIPQSDYEFTDTFKVFNK